MAVVTVTTDLNQTAGVPYTVITDSSVDWSGVTNSVYFFDKASKLTYYKSSGGTVVSLFEEGGGTFVTGGTYSGSTIILNRNDGNSVDVTGITSSSIYTADGTIGAGRVATLTDSLNFSEGTFNLFGLNKDKKVSYVGGNSVFTGPSTYVVNALNFKYDSNTGTGQLWAINSSGSSGKINIMSSETLINNIYTKDDLRVSGNSNAVNAERSIEVPFGTNGTWKGVNMLSTQKSGGGADFEMQVSPGGLGGTYETALKIAKNKDITITKKLELSTTTDGFLMPRLTTAQKNAISSPDTNLMVFDTDNESIERYNGTIWVSQSNGYNLISVNDSNGTPTFYTDLQTAFNATADIDTVYIHGDIELTAEVIIPIRANITIALGGNRIWGDTTAGDFNLFTMATGGIDRILNISGGGLIETIGTAVNVRNASPFDFVSIGASIECYFNDTRISSVNADSIYATSISYLDGGHFYSENKAFYSTGGSMKNVYLDVYLRAFTSVVAVENCTLISRFQGFFCNTTTSFSNNYIKADVTQSGNYGALYCYGSSTVTGNYIEQTNTAGRPALFVRGSSGGIDGDISKNICINKGSNAGLNLVYGSASDNYCYSELGTALSVGGNCERITNNIAKTNSTSSPAMTTLNNETVGNTAININPTNTSHALSIGGVTNEAFNNTAIVYNPAAYNIRLDSTGTLYLVNNIMNSIGLGLDLNGNVNAMVNTPDAYGNIQIG